MPIQVRGVLVHAMSGTELSRVRTELQLRLPEPINKSPLESRGAGIVMQSFEVELYFSGKCVYQALTAPLVKMLHVSYTL
jgi:hypothetical protein